MGTKMTIIFLLAILFGGCSSGPKIAIGNISLGPERMSFTPCDSDKQYWLGTTTFSVDGWEEAQSVLDSQPECSLSTMPCYHQISFLSMEIADKNICRN